MNYDYNKLAKLETQSIDLLRTVAKLINGELWLAYSGGKDSEVCLHLMKKAKINFRVYYNSTGIDQPGTLPWVKRIPDIVIHRPEKTFYQLIEHRGLPSTFQRFCCAILKEKKKHDFIVTGVRRDESKRRADKYQEPEACMVDKWGRVSKAYLPILNWTKADLKHYIEEEQIQCHPIYYDKDGHFHVECRLGCLGCPLPYDRGYKDFKQYPKLVRAWTRSLSIYRLTRRKPQKSVFDYRNEYETFYNNLFCKSLQQLRQLQADPTFNAHKLLMDIFHVQLQPPAAPISKLITLYEDENQWKSLLPV